MLMRRETVRKTSRLHQWDVLRANKAPFAWGLEPRVPFLDKEFIRVSMGIDPAEKMVRHDMPLTILQQADLTLILEVHVGVKGMFAYAPRVVQCYVCTC